MNRVLVATFIACLGLSALAEARTVEEILDEADGRYRETRYYEALDVALDAVDWFPGSPDAHALMGRILFKIARFEEARERFEEALYIDPNHFWARYGLGLYYLARGNPETAVDELAAARELWADNELPCLMLARANEEMDRWGEARAWMDEAVGIIEAREGRAPASLELEMDRFDFLARRDPYRVSAAFDRTTVMMEDDLPVVRVQLGAGVEGRFLLDTAAARGLVAHPAVVEGAAGEWILTLEGGRRESRSLDELHLLSEISIGDLRIYDIPCLVTEHVFPGVDGIIGLPLMKRFAWSFDFESRQVTILDPARDPAWAYRHHRGQVTSGMYTGGPLMIPVRLYEERPAVVVLDSASSAASLDHEFFERDVMGMLPLDWIRDLIYEENPHGAMALVAFDLPSISVDDRVVLEDVVVRTYSLEESRRWAGVAAPGLLGMSLFRGWIVDLDFPEGRITLRRD